jgi:hypothetical protein
MAAARCRHLGFCSVGITSETSELGLHKCVAVDYKCTYIWCVRYFYMLIAHIAPVRKFDVASVMRVTAGIRTSMNYAHK